MMKHDLRLLNWGPYTKKYAGISHLADQERGLRFDLSVFPGYYRRKMEVPSATWESGWHPWRANPELTAYTYRHMLEWKDQLYADITYYNITNDGSYIDMNIVNATAVPQLTVMHLMASLHYPQIKGHGDILQTCRVILPNGAIWIDALDVEELQFATARVTDGLEYDGFRKGEQRTHHFVEGAALASNFGAECDDQATYAIELTGVYEDACMIVRARLPAGISARWQLRGAGSPEEKAVTWLGTGKIENYIVPLGEITEQTLSFRWISAGDSSIELDGFVIVEQVAQHKVDFVAEEQHYKPTWIEETKQSLLLRYDDCQQVYGIVWTYPTFELREIVHSELDRFLRHYANEHVAKVLQGDGAGHYSNIFLRPIPLAPNSEQHIHAAVFSGSEEVVRERIRQFQQEVEQHTVQRKLDAHDDKDYVNGQHYLFSQQLLQATLLTNVVYPVYTKGRYIRHHTPGRWWDSLYTWDSGFIGIGLLELNVDRARQCLDAYVTEPGDSQTAFIHHGSMVPVQHYLWLELWNRTIDIQSLHYFYPRLKQYYLYFVGHSSSSTTRSLASNLLKTWDYFYNSGGWDDYPAQVAVHQRQLTANTAPVITTSQAIRIAKILKMAARQLAEAAQLGQVAASATYQLDIAQYEQDIAMFTEALELAFDEESGFYSYTIHDEHGCVREFLRDEQGVLLNRGLDGLYPIVAGVLPKNRYKLAFQYLTSERHMWTEIGLSVVDKTAPYYSHDGYWNGAVWMSHQWFVWKTMLDLGEQEFAWKIADTALGLWKRETELTYNSYEHFMITSGRGAGWHQFGGLSAPVLSWFASYYRDGTITAGFDLWFTVRKFEQSHTKLQLQWRLEEEAGSKDYTTEQFTLIIVMNTAIANRNQAATGEVKGEHWREQYAITSSVSQYEVVERMPGVLELTFTRQPLTYELQIEQLTEME